MATLARRGRGGVILPQRFPGCTNHQVKDPRISDGQDPGYCITSTGGWRPAYVGPRVLQQVVTLAPAR